MSKFTCCLFGACAPESSCAQAGYAIFRASVGLSMAVGHGFGKIQNPEGFIGVAEKMGMPMPMLLGWAAILSEFACGILVAIGLATRPAAALIAITMAVAAFVVHGADPIWSRTPPSKELALLYLVACIAIMSFGSGKFGLDRLIVGKKD